jgi:hypothetical protein
LIRLLAEYRRQIETDGSANTAALLRALIAELEEPDPVQDRARRRGS